MAALTEINYATKYMEFAIENAAEISLLPTTEAAGAGDLKGYGTATEGSLAFEPDMKFHRLTKTGWTA